MDFETSDGVRLAYQIYGQSGRPLVLQTGYGGSVAIWHAQIKPLLALGYQVFALDVRNQGASERTTRGRLIFRHGQDLAEFIANQQLEQVTLIGNSMGAATIFAYLALHGDQNVAAVVDVDQTLQMINTAEWQYGFKGLTWDNFRTFFKAGLGHSTYKHIDNDTFALVQAADQQLPFDHQLAWPILVDHAFQDWRPTLAQLTRPFLIVCGRESPFFDWHMGRVIADIPVNGRAAVIPEAGHIVMAEQSAAFNQTIRHFLMQVNRA